PGEAPARQAETLAAVHVGRDAAAHRRRIAGADEREVALLERELVGDVADEDVQEAVAVEVAEVDPHALERVVPDHLRARRGERLAPFEAGELESPRTRTVVQQAVRSEV